MFAHVERESVLSQSAEQHTECDLYLHVVQPIGWSELQRRIEQRADRHVFRPVENLVPLSPQFQRLFVCFRPPTSDVGRGSDFRFQFGGKQAIRIVGIVDVFEIGRKIFDDHVAVVVDFEGGDLRAGGNRFGIAALKRIILCIVDFIR